MQANIVQYNNKRSRKERAVSKRINDAFLNHYIELDRLLGGRFGAIAGGVTEYVNRLNNAKYAAGKDEVLPRLVRYRNIRNRFAHEPGAIRKSDELTRADVKWIIRFKHDVAKKRDPLSRYLRKARRYALRKRAYRYLIAGTIGAVVIAALVLCIVYL